MTRLSIMTALWLAGCSGPREAEQASTDLVDCDDWSCGTNSPVIDTRALYFLHVNGAVNASGFRITSFQKAGIGYRIAVVHGRLIGRHATLPWISGSDLRGSEITLQNVWLGGSYRIRVSDVGSTPYWATAGMPRRYETYVLEWLRVGGQQPFRNLCSRPPLNVTDTLGMRGTDTLVFEGERIDAVHKVIDPVIDPEWFNLGCAGHALAKLALTGHVAAAEADGFVTTIPERQTMLKLLVADYCGDGTPFTGTGEPLGWTDHRGWMPYEALPPPSVYRLEARWTEGGPSCLNEPRLLITPLETARLEFPDIEAAIASHCARPPPCIDLDPGHLNGHHLVSANPP